MWTGNPVFEEDLERLAVHGSIPWDKLENKTVFVTGATGLIGFTLTNALLYHSQKNGSRMKVIALVRDIDRAKKKFSTQLAEGCGLTLIEGSVEQLPEIHEPVDYIVHGASPTASIYFVEKPVETITTAVLGTRNMLELAREKRVSSFVYLSSMEVYGASKTDDPICESYPTAVDSMSVRSSYPQAKLLCENLCVSYCSEYGVPAKVVRLAQTFGPGVAQDDGRVFAQFARAVLQKKNIILQTTGESRQTYLYTADAVSAILAALLKGEAGQAYNAANPDTYCSIYEMAQMAANELADGEIQVVIQSNAESAFKFPPTHCIRLNADKLCGLGWQPTVGLMEMYRRMLTEF